MKWSVIFLLVVTTVSASAQEKSIYGINADSTRLYGCDSNELIIENHTQDIPGFLFNTGNGRTVFKRGVIKLRDSLYLIGGDTLKYNAWVQGGNKWGRTGVLGTLDSNHLDIYTNNKLQGRWTNTGRLLIGTSLDSGYKLQVNGTSLFSDRVYISGGKGDGGGQIFFKNGANEYMDAIGTVGYDLFFRTRNISQNFQFQFGTSPQSLSFTSSTGGDISLVTPSSSLNFFNVNRVDGGSNNSLYLISNNYSGNDGVVVTRNPRSTLQTDPIFTIKQSDTIVLDALKNGRVGIGTSSPSAQLHTTGSVRFAGLTNDSTQTRIVVSDVNGNLSYRSASSLAAADVLRSSLAVNGTIRAKELKLSQEGWPDYVFDSTYMLSPLKEVESYIRKNRHLPGIPSADEVAKDGLSVGENQAALTKKIEELTLYTIALEKKLAAQGELLKLMQEQMNEIEKEKQHTKRVGRFRRS